MEKGRDKKYRNSSHVKHRHIMHLVWSPKYRRGVLKGKIAERLKELFYECAEANRWEIEELSIEEDHVHMILRINPNISVGKAVQLLKGGSSRAIRKEFPETRKQLWGDSFWADGYFMDSVGNVSEEIIREYVKNQ